MKNLIALVLLMLPAGGCIIEEHPHRHRTVAVVEPGHVHCHGCGHVRIGGTWYID